MPGRTRCCITILHALKHILHIGIYYMTTQVIMPDPSSVAIGEFIKYKDIKVVKF